MSRIDLIGLLLMLVTSIGGSLIPIVFYKAPFYIRFSLSKRMMLVNIYTAFLVCLATMLIGNNIHKVNTTLDIIGCILWVVLPGAVSVIYYDYFYKEAHHKCHHCNRVEIQLN